MDKFGLGLGLGLGSRGGGGTAYINPDIPAIDNVVRCWSLRRNIADYALGNALKEIRSEGGSNPDVPFQKNGQISITGAGDAYANLIYSQVGESVPNPTNSTFNLCPKVYDGSSVLKGLLCNGDYLVAPSDDAALDTAMAIGASFTHSVWLKTSYSSASALWACGRLNGTVVMGWNRIGIANGKFRAACRSTAGIDSVDNFADGAWHHVLYTCAGAQGATNGLKLYVDGELQNGIDVPVPGAGNATYVIGANPVGGSAWQGEINDIIIYDIALSPEQIATLYNEQKAYYGI